MIKIEKGFMEAVYVRHEDIKSIEKDLLGCKINLYDGTVIESTEDAERIVKQIQRIRNHNNQED